MWRPLSFGLLAANLLSSRGRCGSRRHPTPVSARRYRRPGRARPGRGRSRVPARHPRLPSLRQLGPFADQLKAVARNGLEGGGRGSPAQCQHAAPRTATGWMIDDRLPRNRRAWSRQSSRRHPGCVRDARRPAVPGLLGIFSDRGRADDRAASLRRLKLDAAVSGATRMRLVFWLDVPGAATPALCRRPAHQSLGSQLGGFRSSAADPRLRGAAGASSPRRTAPKALW